MRILHLSSPLTWRGGEQQIAWLAEELRAAEVEQFFMCPAGSALQKYTARESFSCFSYRKIFALNPFPPFLLKKICRKKRIDLIHIHDSHAHTLAWMSAAWAGNSVPWVLSRRVDFPVKAKAATLWKYNHPLLKRIICVSEAVRAATAPAVQNTQKLTVVYDGIDSDRFTESASDILRTEFGLPPSARLIVNVAALSPQKDYLTFLRAAKIILTNRRDVHFFLIGGDGGAEGAIRNFIEKNNLGRAVTLTGFRRDVSVILPEADVFLFTSQTEGMGTAVLDALTARVPTVATRAGGIPEYLVHEKNALTVAVGDANDAAAQVLRLLKNEDLREKLRKNGTRTAERFSKAAMAHHTLAVYRDILLKTS